MTRRILVTSALPYANGPLHLGHIIEALQTDVWVRFQKLLGHEARYVCAEDTHGTPVMIKAQSEGITPEALIARVAAEHRADYQGFLVGHDWFHTTHSPENRHFTDLMFGRLKAAGHITQRSVRQAYDEQAGMFLPDRFVRAPARAARRPTSTAIPARPAARPTPRPISSIRVRRSRAARPSGASPSISSSR